MIAASPPPGRCSPSSRASAERTRLFASTGNPVWYAAAQAQSASTDSSLTNSDTRRDRVAAERADFTP